MVKLTSHTTNQTTRLLISMYNQAIHQRQSNHYQKLLSNNSSNKTILNYAGPLYEKALSKAGYDLKSKSNENEETKGKQKKEHNLVKSSIQQKM